MVDRHVVATTFWDLIAAWAASQGGPPGESVPVAGDRVFGDGVFTVQLRQAEPSGGGGIGDFDLDGTTIDDQGFGLTTAGAVLYTSGNVTALSLTMTGANTWAWNALAQPLSAVTLAAGATITRIANSNAVAGPISVPATATLAANSTARTVIQTVTGNDFLTVGGDVTTAPIISTLDADRTNSGAINMTARWQLKGSNRKVTQSGVLALTDLTVSGSSSGTQGELVIGVTGCNLGDVLLSDGTNRGGRIDLGDGSYAVEIGSISENSGTATNNAFDLGDAAVTITSGKTWEGTGITFSSSAGVTVTGDGTPTITNCGDPGRVINVVGKAIDGGGNHSNWVFTVGAVVLRRGQVGGILGRVG